jgi:hypothetical protein
LALAGTTASLHGQSIDASTPFEAFTVTEVVPEPSATSLLAIPLVGWLIGRFRGRQSRFQV